MRLLESKTCLKSAVNKPSIGVTVRFGDVCFFIRELTLVLRSTVATREFMRSAVHAVYSVVKIICVFCLRICRRVTTNRLLDQ